jgi:CBS domain containing-hemolysin-like protein
VDDPAIWIGITAALLACYLSACNIALRTFSRPKLAELLEQRGRLDRLDPFLKRADELPVMVGTVRTGMNLVVLLCVLAVVQHRYTQWELLPQYGLAFVVAGFIVSIFSVALPVSIARYHPERLLARSMAPLSYAAVLFNPLLQVLLLVDPIVRRMTGGELKINGDDDLADEVMSVVEEHEHEAGVNLENKEMIEAVFEFRTITADEIMTPRTDIEGIEAGASLEQVKQTIQSIGHSRIPVYEENLDHLVGILYVKDLIPYVGQDSGQPFDLRSILREPYMVPESKPVHELLTEFKVSKVHMAIVLDEYGGTAGLVTIEDILEEIVGEIQDEYEPVDETPPGIERLDEQTVLVDARLRVDDLMDELDLELPEDRDYDTVGGFVLATLGHLPQAGEQFDFDGVRVTVTEAERTRVNRVRVERIGVGVEEAT